MLKVRSRALTSLLPLLPFMGHSIRQAKLRAMEDEVIQIRQVMDAWHHATPSGLKRPQIKSRKAQPPKNLRMLNSAYISRHLCLYSSFQAHSLRFCF